jgi:tetratricopeptide (TPR) repeat protein
MNRAPHDSDHEDLPLDLTRKITELDGYYEMGMAREALQLARQLLKYRPVHQAAFQHALWTILVHADRCRTWKRLVEAAYGQLSSRGKKIARLAMLRFYNSMWDYESASRFLPKHPQQVDEVVFSMWTLLGLKKTDRARPLCRKCLKFLRQPQHRFDFSMLVDALADYYAQIGDLSAAEAYWRLAPPEEPFFESAARGLVKIQAVRGHSYVSVGRVTLQKAYVESEQGPLDVILPGNEKSRLANAVKDLQKYSVALTRIVPKRDMWRFGLDPSKL